MRKKEEKEEGIKEVRRKVVKNVQWKVWRKKKKRGREEEDRQKQKKEKERKREKECSETIEAKFSKKKRNPWEKIVSGLIFCFSFLLL